MNEPERDRLLAAYFAGELNEAERALLLAELRADSGFARGTAELLMLDRLLKNELAASDSGAFAREVVERLKAGPPRRAFAANVIARLKVQRLRTRARKIQKANTPGPVWRGLPWTALAAASVVMVLAGYLLLSHAGNPRPEPGNPLAGKRAATGDGQPAPEAPHEKPMVAEAPPATEPKPDEPAVADNTPSVNQSTPDKPALPDNAPARDEPKRDEPAFAGNAPSAGEPKADKPAVADNAPSVAEPRPDKPAVAANTPVAVDPWRGKRLVADNRPVTQDLDGYCQLTLAPGSALVINGGPKARKAVLEQGNVACEVKKNGGAFAIESKLGGIAARDTKFNVSFNAEKEGDVVWGSLAVKVFDGAATLSTPFGANVVFSGEKDWPREGGVATGILTMHADKRDTRIMVRADGEEDEVKYLPMELNGVLDKAMLNTLMHLYPRNRVKLVWAFGEPRRVLAIEPIIPKTNAGAVTGTIIRKNSYCVDVKPRDGPLDCYTVNMPSANSKKATVVNLNEFQTGDSVTIDWSFLPNECKRIEKMEKVTR